MKAFYTTALILISFTSHAFAYHCYFRPYSSDIRVADIHGRQIYTLFSAHLSNQPREIVAILTSSMSLTERMHALDRFIEQHATRSHSEQLDFLQIKSLLASQQIDWIGVEHFQGMNFREVNDQLPEEYLLNKEPLLGMGDIFPFWNDHKSIDLLFLWYHVHVIIQAENPDVFNSINIVNLESSFSLDMASEDDIAIINTKWNEIRESMSAEQWVAFLSLTGRNNGFGKPVSPQELEVFLANHKLSSEFIQEIKDFVDSVNRLVIEDVRRDAFAVETILSQDGNGLVLRGRAHQEKIESGLTQACLDSMGGL